MGSKRRHATEIVAITCAGRKPGSSYIEPFAGGGNVLCCVPQVQGPRIANDINKYMIALLDAVGNKNWLPPETMTKTEWGRVKKNPGDYPLELVAFCATGPTFGSVWMGSWANDHKTTEAWDKYKQARDMCIKDAPGLKDVIFYNLSYDQLTPHIPPESIIYCDPPYASTTIYEGAKTKIKVGESLGKNAWKPLAFWKWADALVDAGHRVYVSEYKGAPSAIYNGRTPELDAERRAASEKWKVMVADPDSPREEREAFVSYIADIDRRISENADRIAARWVSLWSKEVVSDFSSSRTVEDSGKKEIENLFHRAP